MKLLVSIIITYYNQEAFIRETVESACRQTYKHTEVIIVDDGSARPAAGPLADMQDIRLLRKANGGCSRARNFGFAHSQGAFLIFLDGDDRLLPGAVEAHMNAMEENPQAGMVFGATVRIDEHGRQIRSAHVCRPRKNYYMMMFESNPVECPGAALLSREHFQRAGMFDVDLSPVADHALYLRIAKEARVVRITDPVVEYRQHATNMSRDQGAMLAMMLTSLDRFEADHHLSPPELRALHRGRRRWNHVFRQDDTIGYKVKSLYYSVQALVALLTETDRWSRDRRRSGT